VIVHKALTLKRGFNSIILKYSVTQRTPPQAFFHSTKKVVKKSATQELAPCIFPDSPQICKSASAGGVPMKLRCGALRCVALCNPYVMMETTRKTAHAVVNINTLWSKNVTLFYFTMVNVFPKMS